MSHHQSYNLQFIIVLAVLIAVNYYVGTAITGDYLDEYHEIGYLLTQLRSDDTSAKTAALAELTTPLYRPRWRDPRVKSAIEAELDSSNEEIRGWAIYAVGAARYDDLFARLIAELDPERDTSGFAAEALGKLGEKRGTAPLVDFLKRAVTARQRLGALRGIAQIRDVDAGAAVEAFLGDKDEEVQATAFWALGQVKHADAHGRLMELWRNGTPTQRCGALEAIKYIPTEGDAVLFKKEFLVIEDDAECPWIHWEDRDEIRTPIMYKGHYRTKFLKIIANSLVLYGDIQTQRDWFVRVASDRDRPYETRKQADDIVRLMDGK
jgi:hypothetical protein